MNPEIKAKWVAALRSGEYKQGLGYLCDTDYNYCCLGVLTDIYCKEVLGAKLEPHDMAHPEGEWLNDEVRDWGGLNAGDPFVDFVLDAADERFDLDNRLSFINDHGISFSVIADIIEEQL
jgi:hypothetical protein